MLTITIYSRADGEIRYDNRLVRRIIDIRTYSLKDKTQSIVYLDHKARECMVTFSYSTERVDISINEIPL